MICASRPLQALLAAAVLAMSLASARSASAEHPGVRIGQPYRGTRPAELNLHGGLSFRGPGPAAGLRFAIPIVDNGFVSKIDNAIYLTFGADLLFERCLGGCGAKERDYGVAFAIPLTGRWQFNFNPHWSAYGEVGPSVYVHSGWLGDGKFPGIGKRPDTWVAGAVGAKWHFASTTSLTFAVGEPYSHVGLDFLM